MANTVIANELARIEAAKTKFKNKGVEIGISLPNDKIDVIATKFDANLVNRGGISASVKEGESITIAKGYHDGTGTVVGVSGGGSYTLQSKTVTPTKSTQAITSDEGYYGLDAVTVNPIPEAYQDISGTTAEEANVLVTKVFTTAAGVKSTGTMPNKAGVGASLDVETPSFTIPLGYHDGKGVVAIDLEDKSATPSKAVQVITPSAEKVLREVSIAAIPSEFQDVSGITAVASNVLIGKTFVDISGEVEGTMPNNGEPNLTIDGLTALSVTLPQGYVSGGTVTLTDDIENRLIAI